MLRHVIHNHTIRPSAFQTSLSATVFTPARCFASKRAGSGDDEAEIEAARKWLAKLDADTIRNNAVSDISFSRSSGPGGQNVNKYAYPPLHTSKNGARPNQGHPPSPPSKRPPFQAATNNTKSRVSSKATLRLPTTSLLPLLPSLLHPTILNSRYHAAKASALVIQADDSRKQTENVNACWRKLHDLVLEAGAQAVPGETSREQVERVKGLEKADKARTRRMKEERSRKKTARKGGGGDGY